MNYTFTAADNGVHTFMVTLKTAVTQSITVTDTQTASITGTQGGIVVRPAATSKLAVRGFPSPVTAGSSGAVTVTAQDAFGNTTPAYTGMIHFASSDAQAVLPADYTFTTGDNGVHTFNGVILKSAATQSLTATDAMAGSITGTQSGIAVNPAAVQSFQVTGLPATVQAGASFSLTVSALDAYGNIAAGYTGTVSFTSTDTNGSVVLPASFMFTAADAGVHTFTGVQLVTADNQTITATDSGNHLTVTSPAVLITPAPASRFQLTGFPPTIAGTAGTFIVIAYDPYGNRATGYRGTVHFTSSDTSSQVQLPADYPFSATDNGVQTFPATLVTAGTQSLTATDTQTPSITGTQSGIQVTHAQAAQFLITTSVDGSSTVAGTPFDVTVTAQDAYGNTVTDYSGTVTFSSQDPNGATLPPDYTFQPSDQGIATFAGGVTLYTAGVWDATVTDTADNTITGSGNITVTPAAADHLVVTTSADGGSVVAGTAFDLTVMAVDPYGNIDVNYQGTVQFTSTDPQNPHPRPNYTFTSDDNGVHTFAGEVSLYTAGTWNVTATDTANNITGSDSVTVTPATATHFQMDAPATVAPGAAFDVTVTALDDYGNVDVNYRGTVTFTSSDSDSSVILPADYTFQDTDNGVAVFSGGVTLMTPGDQTITATDTASGITGTATVTVQAPAPGASGSAGKGHGMANGEIVAPSQPTAPAGRDAAEGDTSRRLPTHLGATDATDVRTNLELLTFVRRHHAPLSLVETLDQFFLEEEWIG